MSDFICERAKCHAEATYLYVQANKKRKYLCEKHRLAISPLRISQAAFDTFKDMLDQDEREKWEGYIRDGKAGWTKIGEGELGL